MLDLFLIRHGIAGEPVAQESDFDRTLTEAGIQRTRQVAQRLKALNLEFNLILSSPLRRAQQTTELLLDAKLADNCQVSAELAPGGNLANWLAWFQGWREGEVTRLALVGHQPDLGHWAEWLCWGEPRDHLVVKKAGVIGIQVPEIPNLQAQCQLFWLAPPKLLL